MEGAILIGFFAIYAGGVYLCKINIFN